jgi:predicted nicotinamide N-methyase
MDDDELTNTRRLYLQQAPLEVVIASLPSNWWTTLDGQSKLVHALTCGEYQPDVPYQRRIFKHLLSILETNVNVDISSGEEEEEMQPHEELIARLANTYINSNGDTITDSSQWSHRIYDLEPSSSSSSCSSKTLTMRVRSVIGGGYETGGRVWDSALLLGAWIMSTTTSPSSCNNVSNMLWEGRNVIELGCGTGIVGCILALHANLGSLSFTDCEAKVLVNMRHNVEVNLPRDMWKNIYIGTLDWCRPKDSPWLGGNDYDINVPLALDEEDGSSGASTRSIPPPPDTIIASDVVYDPTVVASLVDTIVTLLNVPAAADVDDNSRRRRQRVAYVAAEERNPSTWTVFKNEVQNRNLIIVDRSNEARDAMQMQNSFWVSNETQDRVHVLELKLPS